MSEATTGSTDRRGFLRKGLVAGAGLAAVAGVPNYLNPQTYAGLG